MRIPLKRAAEGLIGLTHYGAAFLLALAVTLVFWQVVTRFLLDDAAGWTEVTARGVIVWMVFLVIGAGFRRSAMIPLEFVRSVAPARYQRPISFVVMALTLVFLSVIAWYGTRMTLRVQSQEIAMLGISISWFYAALPVGALLAIPGPLLEFMAPIADERVDPNRSEEETPS